MKQNYLLKILGATLLLIVVLVGCQQGASPTPGVSPLTSPLAAQDSPLPSPTSSKCPQGCLNFMEDCTIKGIVTGMGDRYYYTEDMEGFSEADLIVKYGGRWFCTVEEAVQNGFEKAPE